MVQNIKIGNEANVYQTSEKVILISNINSLHVTCLRVKYFSKQLGFTYLGVLFLVAMMGLMLSLIGTVWSTTQQREREKELLFVGEQFRQAIKLYYDRTPGIIKQYPPTLEELIKDSRYLTSQRYLRKIYIDPITGKGKWGVVKHLGGGVEGVYSLSTAKPIKQSNFSKSNKEFEAKLTYSEWKFIYTPQQVTTSSKSVADINLK